MKIKKNLKFIVAGLLLFSFVGGSFAAGANQKEEDTFYVAVRSFQDGFYDVALTLFDRYLKNYVEGANRFEALLYIGECYFFQEKYVKALDQFESLRLMPGTEPIRDKVLFWLGEVYGKGRDYKQAAEYYNELIDNYKDSSYLLPATRSLAEAYLSERNYTLAVGAYRRIAQSSVDPAVLEEAAFGVIESLYLSKDYPALKKELADFIARYPNSTSLSRVYFYLAEANYYLGAYHEAVALYEKCLSLAAPSGDDLKNMARIGLGWAYLKLKNYDSANEVFGRFEGEDIPSAVTLGRGVLSLEQGACDEALKLFERVINEDKEGTYAPLSFYGKAESFYRLSRFSDAIIAYRISLDKLKILTGNTVENRELRDKIYYGLAWSYLKAGDFSSAQEMFQKIATLTTDKIFKLSALCQLGDTYQDSGNYDKAIQTYQKFLEDYPESIYTDYVQYQIGMTWLKAENTESAILAFRKFIKEYPGSKLIDEAHYFLGVTYFQKGDFSAARQQLEVFVREFKDSAYRPEALFLLGETLFNAGDTRQASDMFGELIKDYPRQESLRQKAEYEIANMFAEQGNAPEAQKHFSDFIVRYPDSPLSPNILFWLGQNSSSSKDPDAALKFFERLVRQYPHHEVVPEAYVEIGVLSKKRGQTEQALRSFEMARELGDSATQGRSLLLSGDVYREDGDEAHARSNYEDAVKKEGPWAKTALVRLAQMDREDKMFSSAINNLEKSLTFQGAEDNAQIQWMLAEIYEEEGKVPEALDAYMKYYYLYPGEARAVKALLRVAKINEDRESWVELRKVLEKIATLPVPEAKYASEKLAELKKRGL